MKIVSFLIIFVLFCLPVQAKQVASAFLIVPGTSIGKIKLGDKRDQVHKKMGKPQATLIEKSAAYRVNPSANTSEGYARDGEYLKAAERNVTTDVYLRPKADGSLKIIYDANRVVQIQVSLSGYKTQSELSIHSDFSEWAERYGFIQRHIGPKIVTWVIYPDEYLGHSPFVEEMWDYVPKGLALLSKGFYAGGLPQYVRTIIVHEPNRLVLNFSRNYGGDLISQK